ncbi:winged helix-turn-helix domain-containing protein [Streptomyces sp. NPDC001034]|uniref:ArsR/SmtB family transcription factor n=1 Tax=Streptomyces sp. NPDC001034 TaxID=3154375 RepID=UPI003319E5EA
MQRILDSPDVVTRLADALEASRQALVEPDWPRLRTVLERDLVRRAGHLAMYGWAAALSDLDPRVRWHSQGQTGTIEVHTGSRTAWDRYQLAGKGLLLMPTVFGTLISYVEPPWPYALVYPARGIAGLLGPVARTPGGEALSRLLGPHRADVLRALDVPATMTQLVAQLGLSLGTVGSHLAVLRDAGLGHPHPHRPDRPLRAHTAGRSPGGQLNTTRQHTWPVKGASGVAMRICHAPWTV